VNSPLLQSITGIFDTRQVARQKFLVFALVASLLVPNAARSFHDALKDEQLHQGNEQRQRRMLRKIRREHKAKKRFEKRIDRLCDIAQEAWMYPNNFATADSISCTLPPFPPPHWVGDERPHGAREVRLHTQFPSAGYLAKLVSDYGYEPSAALAALSRAHEPWTRPPADRRTANAFNADGPGRGVNHEYSSFASEHPYHPASPMLRTTSGGGFKKQKVTEAIAKHRWDDKHSTAVFDVVYLQREPFLVAASLGLKVETVYQYSSRVRADLRAGQAPRERLKRANLHAESSNSFVFSECVEVEV
jgi:hypothetical protein